MKPTGCTTEHYSWRQFRSTVMLNTALGFGIFALNYAFNPSANRVGMWNYLAANMVYAHVIGTLAAYTIPVLAMRIWRERPLVMWPIYISGLILVAVVGTVLAVGACWLLGLSPTAFVWPQIRASVKVATIITLIVGITIYVFEGLKNRIEHTTLELRQQQLERERAEKLALEARFTSLQSRLHPHFLFNTINSILSLIREDQRGAEDMLHRLSRLLRYALDSQQRSVVTLGEELKLVTDYLEIEKTRFGQRLHFTVDVPAELQSWEMPPYALQTLVENSMKYAVAPRREGGAILVRARAQGGLLCLEVRDDGSGFTRDDLAEGHGLDTLEKRMQLLYGDAGGLDIRCETGCCVSLRLPAGVVV